MQRVRLLGSRDVASLGIKGMMPLKVTWTWHPDRLCVGIPVLGVVTLMRRERIENKMGAYWVSAALPRAGGPSKGFAKFWRTKIAERLAKAYAGAE